MLSTFTFKPHVATVLRRAPEASEVTGRLRVILRQPVVVIAIWLTFFFLIQWYVAFGAPIQIGADEGFELAKATLCLKGYKLYNEVWNDQPPLHTFIITQVLKHLSPSIMAARVVTWVFSAILLTSLFFIFVRVNGLFVAALATALLVASPGFIELSASCMLEIPALSLALAAICILVGLGPLRRAVPTIGAGVLLGLAFQIKLVDVILLPLAALVLWLRRSERMGRGGREIYADDRDIPRRFADLLRSLLILGGSIAITFVALDYFIERGAFLLHFQQSWSSHFGSAKSFEYGRAPAQWNGGVDVVIRPPRPVSREYSKHKTEPRERQKGPCPLHQTSFINPEP